MKITKILTIATLAFAAHGVQAQIFPNDTKITNLSMEMPLESNKAPFSYNNEVGNEKLMEMPLESSEKPFSYSKEEVKSNIMSLAEKFRNNNQSDKKSLKI